MKVTMLSDKHSLSLKSPWGMSHNNQCPRLSLKSEGVHLSTHSQQAQLSPDFPSALHRASGFLGQRKASCIGSPVLVVVGSEVCLGKKT